MQPKEQPLKKRIPFFQEPIDVEQNWNIQKKRENQFRLRDKGKMNSGILLNKRMLYKRRKKHRRNLMMKQIFRMDLEMKEMIGRSKYKYNIILMLNKQTEQIFSQLQGAFAWVEKMRKKKPMTSDMQIKELLYFLNIDATNEEIEALNELANPEGEQDIQYEKLYKVFMNDQQQEQREVLEAFRLLSGSNRIEVDKLENWLYIYDKKYRNNTKQFIAQLKQSPSYKQGYLDFEKYVKEG